MSPLRVSLFALGCLVFSSATASAHTRLTSPAPRSPDDGIEDAPCGDSPRGTPTVWEPGAEVTITWNEEANHPGHYRLALSPFGDGGFEENILLDNITDIDCAEVPCAYSATVTLPEEPCENCTLQLIQFVNGIRAYYSCADVTIGTPSPPPPDDPMDDPSDDDTGSPEQPAKKKSGGGCNAGGGASFGAFLLFLAIAIRTISASDRRRGRRR